MSDLPTSFTTRLAAFIARLDLYLADPDPAAPLPDWCRTVLRARLRVLGAMLDQPGETPVSADPPPEPRFVPTSIPHRMVFPSLADPPPSRPDLPTLTRLRRRQGAFATALLPGRPQLEALLREPEGQAVLAGDRALARALRPLAWMLGVDAALLPRARPRPTVILVPGADVRPARAAYAAARATMTEAEILARFCASPTAPKPGSQRRPVWLGPDPCLPAIIPRHRAPSVQALGLP